MAAFRSSASKLLSQSTKRCGKVSPGAYRSYRLYFRSAKNSRFRIASFLVSTPRSRKSFWKTAISRLSGVKPVLNGFVPEIRKRDIILPHNLSQPWSRAEDIDCTAGPSIGEPRGRWYGPDEVRPY